MLGFSGGITYWGSLVGLPTGLPLPSHLVLVVGIIFVLFKFPGIVKVLQWIFILRQPGKSTRAKRWDEYL